MVSSVFTISHSFLPYYLSFNLFYLSNYNLVDLDAVGYNGFTQHYGYLDLKAHLSATYQSGSNKKNERIKKPYLTLLLFTLLHLAFLYLIAVNK